MVLGVPVKLLHEASGHIITVEITDGTLYRGRLQDAEDNMNIQLREITSTSRDGQVHQLDQLYIRGSHIRYFVIPDMFKNAPMFKTMMPGALKGRGLNLQRRSGRGASFANRGRGFGGR